MTDEKPQKKGWGSRMRKWEGEKGPPYKFGVGLKAKRAFPEKRA